MATNRIQPHHPFPPPAGFSVPQSKSHVLAGVQDAYWSDDEAEDAECPLCLEEMDISDLNFKPCVCGYQICRFCWHHIKENLNKRCPACRRIYTDEAVEFKPINKEDHKRLMQQKKQRERERKELESLGRRNLANVRVVQRNVVYVVGIGPRFAKEELIPTLRSEDYFGKYGRISKILLVKRTPPGGREPVVGLYITYHRREDAARAISAVDGATSPSGGREIMRASYGTTKYCMTFLRGANCNDQNCMNLHEWGDEKDCFTKEDLTTLKHTIKQTESRARGVNSTQKIDEHEVTLPRAVSWAAHKASRSNQTASGGTNQGPGVSSAHRQSRRGGPARPVRGTINATQMPTGETRSTSMKMRDKKIVVGTTGKPSSQASSSRPPTPANALSAQRPATPPDMKVLRTKIDSPRLPHSPAPSTAADSDQWSSSQDVPSSAVPSNFADAHETSIPSTPAVPPGLALVSVGLSAPPGIPVPSRPLRLESASPQTPLLSSQTTYQMSNAARALIDDVKARRENAPSSVINPSPFPDFDRTLQTLSGGDHGGFSFNLDPKLAHEDQNFDDQLSNFEDETNAVFQGSYTASFPNYHSGVLAPPGLSYTAYHEQSKFDSSGTQRPCMIPLEPQASNASSYIGSFDPFSDPADDSNLPSLTLRNPVEDDTGRKVSRFGFARGRQVSTTTPSPLHATSPMNASINENQMTYCLADPYAIAKSSSLSGRQEHSYSHPSSVMGSPLVQFAQPHGINSPQSPTRFQPFDSTDSGVNVSLSEAKLREFIQSSRERASVANMLHNPNLEQNNISVKLPFNDPAIMSAGLGTPLSEHNFIGYGGPPGLVFPPSLAHNVHNASYVDEHRNVTNAQGFDEASECNIDPPNTLSIIDFPALTTNTPEEQTSTGDAPSIQQNSRVREKAERKAAEKAAAVQKAAERRRVAQEKATLKAAEKAKAAQEKAAERERLTALKEEQQRADREREREMDKNKEHARGITEQESQSEKGKAPAPEMIKPGGKKVKGSDVQKLAKSFEVSSLQSARRASTLKAQPSSTVEPTPTIEPAPLLSKKPKKNKAVGNTKLTKVMKEEEQILEDALPLTSSPDVHSVSSINVNVTPHRSQIFDRNSPTPLEEIFDELDLCYPWLNLANHPFFDLNKVNPAARMPLEYGPLVHALSALSVGGGSFANNMPSGSIDNAVSSFQQLLETLTQTISDLLRLLPRTTWDDSSSFDGVLRDMLRGDDFLDDAGDEGQNKEDEVAALTLALERRARWMEVQLSKLEELHRDINLAAVRAVLSFNDNGWDRSGFLPRLGNTLKRYDSIGLIEEGGSLRRMTIDELEKKVAVAKEAAIFAETEVKETMAKVQSYKPLLDYY